MNLLTILKEVLYLLNHPDPQSWPDGYGAFWNHRARVIWKVEQAIKAQETANPEEIGC